ncbi:MAG: SAM-dependent methyltransferase [Clostridia bacterium]|nr:SAM-dependent methyltransferase [Clostridia bacterium]
MNKKNIDKVSLFLYGICGRLSESTEYFECIDVKFTAGIKDFSLKAILKDEKLEYIYNGERYSLDGNGFSAFICRELENYDAMVLEYKERGKIITVSADAKGVTSNTKNAPQSEKGSVDGAAAHNGTSSMLNREYYIKPNEASELLKVIGIMGQNGKIKNDKIRKYNQIDHFIELLHPLLVSLCKNKRPINIIDCACGKSYLSFVLNYYIKEVLGHKCSFTGLDYNSIVIADSKEMAQELRYNNMEFIETDIMKYTPDKQYDLLLTLHACDVATDYALNFAMEQNVKSIVCVPCCHREMNSQYSLKGFEGVTKHGVLRARIAACLTDGMRAMYLESQGYDVSVVEYVSPLDTPKNIMIKAEKKSGENMDKVMDFYNLCSDINVKLSIGK